MDKRILIVEDQVFFRVDDEWILVLGPHGEANFLQGEYLVELAMLSADTGETTFQVRAGINIDNQRIFYRNGGFYSTVLVDGVKRTVFYTPDDLQTLSKQLIAGALEGDPSTLIEVAAKLPTTKLLPTIE